MRRLFRNRSKAPIGVAGLLSFPLFLATLMAASLAIDTPRRVQWRGPHGIIEVDHPSPGSTEAKIWLLALVPSAILLLVALGAMLWRRGGVYVVSAAAIVLALGLPHRLDRWTKHHTARFPHGIDLIPDGSNSNLASRGEWEASARDTVLSLTHWTIGIALGAALVVVALALRRRLAPRTGAGGPPLPVVTGGPEISPVLEAELGRSQIVRRGLGGRLFGGGR